MNKDWGLEQCLRRCGAGCCTCTPPQSRRTQGWRPRAGAAGALGRQARSTEPWGTRGKACRALATLILTARPRHSHPAGPAADSPGQRAGGTCGTPSLIPRLLCCDTTGSPEGRGADGIRLARVRHRHPPEPASEACHSLPLLQTARSLAPACRSEEKAALLGLRGGARKDNAGAPPDGTLLSKGSEGEGGRRTGSSGLGQRPRSIKREAPGQTLNGPSATTRDESQVLRAQLSDAARGRFQSRCPSQASGQSLVPSALTQVSGPCQGYSAGAAGPCPQPS